MRFIQLHPNLIDLPGLWRSFRYAVYELGLLGVVVAAFLVTYIHRFHAPLTALEPHVSFVATLWSVCVGLRFLICGTLNQRAARWFNACIVTASLIAFGACEIGFVIGLAFWGRIPTWPLIETYIPRSSDLLDALELSPALVHTSFAGVVSFLVLRLSRPSAFVHWIMPAARQVPRTWLILLSLSASLVVSVRLYEFTADPPTGSGEPFSMMLFPGQHSDTGQTPLTKSSGLDAAEVDARADYVMSSAARRKNVILIVGDALRADRMSAYGYSRKTTPYIDSLVVSGRAGMGRMASVCSESSCGLMAIAQSRYAHQFPSRPITLYEVLQRHGYAVRMILGGDHTNFYGLRASFGKVDGYFDGSMAEGYYPNDDRLVLDRVANLPVWDGKPVMMQLHLMSSHPLGKRYADFDCFVPSKKYLQFGRGVVTPSEESIESAGNYYDNGVLQFDSMVRGILEKLTLKGYLEDAIVLITADHGEMLGEHGRFSHGAAVYQPALRVPFVVIGFGNDGFARQDPSRLSSQVDIAPSVLRELNMPIPRTWSGRALQDDENRDYVFFQQQNEVGLFDVRGRNSLWKYWLNLADNKEYAFDLSADEREAENLIDAVAPVERSRWRLAVMGMGASVSFHD